MSPSDANLLEMKIAQITYPGFGGLGSVVFSLVEADTHQKNKWFIGFYGDTPISENYVARCAELDIAYRFFENRAGGKLRAWNSLSSWLEEIRPDVVICHGITALPGCLWYGWRRRIPIVGVEHTPNAVKTRNERWASAVNMIFSDRVVLLTREYQSELRAAQRWYFRSDKVTIIPNGVAIGKFFPKNRVNEGKVDFRIGMAGRFSSTKRQDILIDAILRINAKRPDLKVRLCLAGDGAEYDRIEEFARQSGADRCKVSFEGQLEEREVAAWLRTLDLYVHASEGETLSTSILQAMATSLPVVASNVPGIRNLLGTDGRYGACVANDPDEFAEKIIGLLDNSDGRYQLGYQARQDVLQSYSHTGMLNSYIALINDCRAEEKV